LAGPRLLWIGRGFYGDRAFSRLQIWWSLQGQGHLLSWFIEFYHTKPARLHHRVIHFTSENVDSRLDHSTITTKETYWGQAEYTSIFYQSLIDLLWLALNPYTILSCIPTCYHECPPLAEKTPCDLEGKISTIFCPSSSILPDRLIDILAGYINRDWPQLKRELESLYTSSARTKIDASS